MDILVVLGLTAGSMLWFGCGGPPKTAGEITGDLSGPRLETVWVDPEIVYSDTLISLIRANRVDSIMLAPDEQSLRPPASIEFTIENPRCNVSVNLLDAYGQLVHPLMIQRLTAGFYRLTVHANRSRNSRLLPGPYLIEADVCNQKRRTEIQLN